MRAHVGEKDCKKLWCHPGMLMPVQKASHGLSLLPAAVRAHSQAAQRSLKSDCGTEKE